MASKLKRRTATATDEAEVQVEAAPRRTLSTRAIDPGAVAAAARAALGGGGGGGTNFLKLNADKTVIRIYPGDPLFVHFRQNMTKVAGRFNTTLDFESVFENPALHNMALAAGKINSDDFEKYQKFGDPFISTMVALKKAGVKLAQGQSFWPQTRALFNVINRADGQIYLWEASKTAFESIMTLFGKLDEDGQFVPGEYPELFNEEDGFDIVVQGNGMEGKARRYTGYTPARSQTPLGEFSGEPYDLMEQMVRRVTSWDDRARQMFASYGNLAQVAGIYPDTWGLNAIVGASVDEDDAATPDANPSE